MKKLMKYLPIGVRCSHYMFRLKNMVGRRIQTMKDEDPNVDELLFRTYLYHKYQWSDEWGCFNNDDLNDKYQDLMCSIFGLNHKPFMVALVKYMVCEFNNL